MEEERRQKVVCRLKEGEMKTRDGEADTIGGINLRITTIDTNTRLALKKYALMNNNKGSDGDGETQKDGCKLIKIKKGIEIEKEINI